MKQGAFKSFIKGLDEKKSQALPPVDPSVLPGKETEFVKIPHGNAPKQDLINDMDAAVRALGPGWELRVTEHGGWDARKNTPQHPKGEAGDVQLYNNGKLITPKDNPDVYQALASNFIEVSQGKGMVAGIGGYDWGIHLDQAGWRQKYKNDTPAMPWGEDYTFKTAPNWANQAVKQYIAGVKSGTNVAAQQQAGPNLTDKQLAAMKKEIEKEMSTVSAQAPTVAPSSADTDRIKKLAGISDEQTKLNQLLQANPGMKISNVIHPGSVINLPDGSKYKIGKGDNLTRISQGKYKGEIVTPTPTAAPTTATPAVAAPAAVAATAPVAAAPAADLRQAAGTVTAPYEPKIDKLDPMGRPYPPGANDYQRSVIDALASKGIATNDPNLIATEPSPSIQQPSVPEPVPYDVLRKQFEKEKILGAGGGVVANPDVTGTYDPSKYAQPQSVINKVTGSDAYKGVVDAIKTAAGSTPVKSFKDYIGNIMQSPGPFGNLKVNPQDTTGNDADYEFLKSQGVDAFKPEVPAKESVQKTNEYGNTDPAKDFTNTSASKVMYPPVAGPDEIGDLIKQLDKMDAPATVFDPAATGPAQKFDPNAKIPQPGQFLKQDNSNHRKPITEKELIVKDEGEIEADGDEGIEIDDKPVIRTKDSMHNEAEVSESLFKDSLNLIKKFAGI